MDQEATRGECLKAFQGLLHEGDVRIVVFCNVDTVRDLHDGRREGTNQQVRTNKAPSDCTRQDNSLSYMIAQMSRVIQEFAEEK